MAPWHLKGYQKRRYKILIKKIGYRKEKEKRKKEK
jgi:hypothetical protein